MDTQRLILFFVFSFSLLLLWEAWQKESRPAQTAAAPTESVPAPSAPPKSAQSAQVLPPAPQAAESGASATLAHERIQVSTDLLRAEIDTNGGDLAYLELVEHKDTSDKSKPVVLFGPEHNYAAQSGLIGPGLPNHRTAYSSAQKQVVLKPGQDSVEVRLEAPGPEGVKAAKILRFTRGSYLIEVRQEIENQSSSPVSAHAYFQLVRDGKSPADANRMASTYTGAAVYSEIDKFHKVAFGDIDKAKTPYTKTPDNGWVAMIQHYFVAAIIPPDKTPRENYTRKLAEDYYAVGVIEPIGQVQPGAKASASAMIYAGPQEQSILKDTTPGLDLVVDYGWLTIIAAPLFWVLEVFHRWTGNWGLAIILLTVTIKLIFFPLSAASYRSMARMKLVAPRLTKIRETYADDRMKQNQAMMELYKTEKINPLGGCLPIAVQIPVFIALYWVLLAAVELRHAPFYGWITDLSAADPWYVLPSLMMASMLLQTKMNPKPPDPVQAKVMMIMPFAFGVMFFFFPAGLVLYWVVNNVLSILQQWQINRMFEGAKVAAKR
jgi:YidC/Oxa1 family membrane protein insertase